MDRIEAMQTFVTVADLQGFAPAARKLGLSPPAVTRLIAALEERLGARLLQRTTRKVALTAASPITFAVNTTSSGDLTATAVDGDSDLIADDVIRLTYVPA